MHLPEVVKAVQEKFDCACHYVRTEHISEPDGRLGKTWKASVEVFELGDHRAGQEVYAWYNFRHSGPRVWIFSPGVDSGVATARDAVRAAIAESAHSAVGAAG